MGLLSVAKKESEVKLRKSNEKIMRNIASIIGIVIFVIAIIVIVLLLNNSNETYISETKQNEASEYISCTAANPSDQFFEIRSKPINTKHEIKATFRGDSLDKIFYSFHGEYDSNNGAIVAEFDITDKYNKYVAGVGLKQDVLSPKISSSESSADASFYVDGSKLKSVLTPVFFLDKDEYSGISSGLKDYLLSNYKNKGFVCEES